MLSSTLYVRVVPQGKDRGYMLLAGYEASVVQRTALQYTTLSNVTRASLNAAIERMRASNSAATVKDVTDAATQKKLAKLFGEVQAPAAPTTFAGMGIGSYLQG